jgi:hypothetical protein
MSRIDELKKQFPELNMTIFDLFKRIDTTSTYKYFPLLCKVFGKRFNIQSEYSSYNRGRLDELKLEYHENLLNKGVSTDGLTDNELFFMYYLSDHFNSDIFHTVKDFIRHMDRNQIENKDVTSYSTIDDLRSAITLASMKELTKELEGQVIKEYEDDKWLVVRPLTFQASAKYGASTRWCTTYQKEKQYFEKYWQNGILVYFINKQTGYKFAGYKSLDGDKELSFWNAEDSRVDYLYVEADDYLFPIVRRILGSDKTNKQLCSDDIVNQVKKECGYNIRKMSLSEPEPTMMGEEIGEVEAYEPRNYQIEMDRMGGEIAESIDNSILHRLVETAREAQNQVNEMEVYGEQMVMEDRPMRA